MNALAIQQIRALATPAGAIQLSSVTEESSWTVLHVSLDTHGLNHAPGGIRIRQREKFEVWVPSTYPFTPPSVKVPHRRWGGTPHVQWGRHLCLYAAPSVEWNPGDGLRGLFDRLADWLENAAAGTLDPEGQPLHPPAVYHSATAGQLLVRRDIGAIAPWAGSSAHRTRVLYAWCVRRDGRSDVLEWLEWLDILNRVLAEDFVPTDAENNAFFAASTVLISDQIAFEYPERGAALIDALQASGVDSPELFGALARSRLVNAVLEDKTGGAELPSLLVLGTPARRVEGEYLAHLSAWELDETSRKMANVLQHADFGVLKSEHDEMYELAERFFRSSAISWMRVWEDRREVTRPRDGGTTADRLRGRRVLVLGAGALGAPIAEHCVRAGAQEVTVLDNGRVNPGILSRQPYADADIGRPKATVLAARLSTIWTTTTVHSIAANALHSVLASDASVPDFDLIIDATADVGVRNAIERQRMLARTDWPDVLSVMIGHDATRGIVTASPQSTSGGPVDVLRRFSIECLITPSLADISEDFFPRASRTSLFFPEPGCSSPTFVGSHSDIATLAGMLLDAGVALFDGSASMGASAVRRGGDALPARVARRWRSDVVLDDANSGGYEVRVSLAALDEMRTEARRGRRVRGANVETGGMLLGAADDACLFVNVDSAAGPPPDSVLTSKFFSHGTVGTQDLLDHRRDRTDSRQGFVGLWHTHPGSRAEPSLTDDEGMWRLVNVDGIGRRAMMLILGGEQFPCWLDGRELPDIYARISVLDAMGKSPRRQAPFEVVQGGFAGGFAYPSSFHGSPGARQ